MRVLVTGSAGKIGSALVARLTNEGHAVSTFDHTAQPHEAAHAHLPGDLRDVNAVRRAVQGADAVMHLGAIAHDRFGAPEDVLAVNVLGTLNVLLACGEAGVKRVVFFSSVNALGNFQGHRVTTRFPIDDNYPRHPISPYQVSKYLGEEACRSFSDRYGMVTICLRPVLVAGPEMYARWREHGDTFRADMHRPDYWSYVDLSDVCDAALLALTAEGVTHGAFLLAAPDTTMAAPTAELVDRWYPDVPWPEVSRKEWLAGRPNRSLVDCAHAAKVLGWEPRHTWREG